MNFEEVREYQPGDEVRVDRLERHRADESSVRQKVRRRTRADRDAGGRCERLRSFGGSTQSKRELAAEIASVLAFSAIRNNDKVGLILFTEGWRSSSRRGKVGATSCESFAKFCFLNHRDAARSPGLALDYLNKIVTRRAVVFFISDFQAPDFSRALAVSGRRHDFIAIQIRDERERSLPNVGIITLEDAETGEQIEINTADRKTRTLFTDLVTGFETELSRTLRRNNVDTITLQTGRDYLPPLRSFFKQRERRLGVR